MSKFRLYVYSCLLALVLLKVYAGFFTSYPSFYPGRQGINVFVLSLLLGSMFGAIGCPFCAFPAGIAIVSGNKDFLPAVLNNVVFHLARTGVLFLYGILGAKVFEFFPAEYGIKLAVMIMGATGIFFLLGRESAGKMCRAKILKFKPFSLLGKQRILTIGSFSWYGLWGFSLGWVCAFEATGFLSPLWAYPGSGFWIEVLPYFIFAGAGLISATVLVLLLLGIRNIFQKILQKDIMEYFKKTTGFFLLGLAVLWLENLR